MEQTCIPTAADEVLVGTPLGVQASQVSEAMCACVSPGNDMGWDLSFLAEPKLKTCSPLVWQEAFEATAKTSVSFSLATQGILRERLKA